MTPLELKETREDASKNKFKSRTFWLAIVWMSFIPISIVAQVLFPEVDISVAAISSFAGSISLLYIGGNKGINLAETLKLSK